MPCFLGPSPLPPAHTRGRPGRGNPTRPTPGEGRREGEGPKPYKFIGFGGIHGPKPYKFIWFGEINGPKPYKFIRVW